MSRVDQPRGKPCFVRLDSGERRDRDRELVRRLTPTIELPGQVLVVARYGAFRGLAARIMSFRGAEVFRRNRPDPEAPPDSSGSNPVRQ